MTDIPDDLPHETYLVVADHNDVSDEMLRLTDVQYRWHLQMRFWDEIVSRPRLRNIVHIDLRNSWSKTPRDLKPFTLGSMLPPSKYRADLEAFVGHTLNAKSNGVPALWLLILAHRAVAPKESPILAPQFDGPTLTNMLQLEVTALGAAYVDVLADRGEGWENISHQVVQGPIGAFTSWDALRDEGYRAINVVVAELRREFEKMTPEYVPRQAAKLRKRESNMSGVVDFLISDGKLVESRTRRTFNKLVKTLGLDPPGKTSARK